MSDFEKNSLTCHIPIILLTACTLEEQIAEGLGLMITYRNHSIQNF